MTDELARDLADGPDEVEDAEGEEPIVDPDAEPSDGLSDEPPEDDPTAQEDAP